MLYQSFVDCLRVIATKIVIRGATVTVKIKSVDEWMSEMTPEKARAFIRKIMGPERRKIEGTEREHLFTVFKLLEPIESTNNQRSFTDVYEHAGKTYHVHYFEGETELEEILPDDIQQD